MTKIVVPDGMLRAAAAVEVPGFYFGISKETGIYPVLEAAIRWLAENPIVPTERQVNEVLISHPREKGECLTHSEFCFQWQRMMFLSPEPEVPEEIKDLLCLCSSEAEAISDHRSKILEAYRRGRNAR